MYSLSVTEPSVTTRMYFLGSRKGAVFPVYGLCRGRDVADPLSVLRVRERAEEWDRAIASLKVTATQDSLPCAA